MLSRRRKLEISLLALGVAALLWVYLPSLAGKFVYDDHHFVGNNKAVQTLAAPGRFFTDPHTLSDHKGMNLNAYRPLTSLSYAADYALAGPAPGWFRLVNLLLHCCSVVLLYYLCGLLGLAAPLAALAAGFFAFFPAGVEAFVWVSGRSGALSTALILLSLYCFGRYARDGGRTALTAASLTCCAALLSRETAVMIPALAAAWLFFYNLASRKRLRAAGLYLALPAAVFLALRFAVLGRFHQVDSSAMTAGLKASLPFILFAKYAEITLWPFRMLVSYSDLIIMRLAHLGFYLPFALLVAFLYAGLIWALYRKGARAAAFGLTWYGLTLLPALNIAQMTFYMAERMLYLPVAGAAIALGGAVQALAVRPRLRTALAAAAMLLLAAFPWEIRRRLPVWKDDVALWSYDAIKNPHNFFTKMRLADAFTAAGDGKAALDTLYEALGSADTSGHKSMAFNQIGVLFAGGGKTKMAELYFEASVTLNPGNHIAHYNLGRSLALQGRAAVARKHVAEALRLSPGYTPAQELSKSLRRGV